ncbi:MAG: acetyl ornithine aminotransferase family protein [Acidobacteriota bacterium]
MKYPNILTELPGPKSRKLIDLDNKYVSSSYTRYYPLTIKRANGVLVEDLDGNIFLDFSAGIAVNSSGHTHPEIVKVIKEQAEKFIHMSGTDFYYEPQVYLAKKLSEIVPIPGEKKVFFGNSGTEAVEAAIKLSRHHTKKHGFIAFYGSFHGRTMGSLSLTASKSIQRKGMGPFLSEVYHTPYAYCYRCVFGKEENTCETECVNFIKEYIFEKLASPDDIAAIIVEPIQGEGGYIIPPKKFFTELKKLCVEYKILLIIDEIQSGMGRTGKMFAFEHFDITPDILCLAKGIASGMPLGVIISRAELMNWPSGAHASTFGGNPISSSAALATIKLLQEELIENAKKMGELLLSKMKKYCQDYEIVGDIRGLGLMIGIELVEDKKSKRKAKQKKDMLVQQCFKRGLLILGAGENVIRFCPSLNITEENIDVAIEIFYKSLKDVEKS